MRVYYNEFDANAAAWLRELIRADLIPDGDVDERSIVDVSGTDLAGYEQCHFFAGIGGWAYALQLAGWDGPVWTGSCPCQPYSAAGKQQGAEDHRNLWPAFRRLIAERRPVTVFGEQVNGAVGFGWIDRVRRDMEAEAYAIGACVLGAHSTGAPHIRQRLFWVAHAGCERGAGRGESRIVADAAGTSQNFAQERQRLRDASDDGRSHGRLALSERDAREPRRPAVKSRTGSQAEITGTHAEPGRCGVSGGLANGAADGRWQERTNGRRSVERSLEERWPAGSGLRGASRFWDRYDLIPCLDGKARRVEPGSFPLAHGISSRMVRLRGYGNAIVPQVAAEFVKAFMEIAR